MPVVDIVIIALLLLIVIKQYGYGIFKEEKDSDDNQLKWIENPAMPHGGYFQVPKEMEHMFNDKMPGHPPVPSSEPKPEAHDGGYV